jgi:Kazal-type serine protease inhibitor-like protein
MKMKRVRWALLGCIAIVGLLSMSSGHCIAASLGETCGGFAGIPCSSGLWCDRKPGFCNGADIQGTCERAAEICPLNYNPICGCDGKTYGNDCERRRARVAKSHDGPCK